VTPKLVLGWVTELLRMDKPSRYITGHPSQLSLAIPPWVSAMSSSLWAMGRRPCVVDWGMTRLLAALQIQLFASMDN